jgi:glutamate transport system ATP-binding protein
MDAVAESITTRSRAMTLPSKPARDPAQPPCVSLRQVSKFFGKTQVLDNVSLDVAQGEVIVICGPSGSGKSTCIRCINQLEPIQSGEIHMFGQPIDMSKKGLAELRTKVGMVFQSFNLYPHKTALENVILAPMKVKNMHRAQAEEIGRQLLKRVGLEAKANAYPAFLSGGQQQRVAIARALAMQPKVMLFDEPTSALDPEMIQEVLDVIVSLAADGMTMLIVTHEMNFARRVADRVVFMDAGKILEVAPPAEFFSGAKDARARQFLSKILSH